MAKLAGKIAVITGGSTGIGLATARLFVAEGAHVYITGRRQAELDAAVAAIGAHVTAVQGDVASLADLDRLYAQIKAEKGRIDVLFANAGMVEQGVIGEVSEAQFDRGFDVNVKGLFFTVQKALPLFTRGGTIVLNASVVGSKGGPASSVYSATKAAVRSFARTWTTDLKERGIRVNALSPGPTETPVFYAGGRSEEQVGAVKTMLASLIPLGRLGRPEETAKAALFLACDDSSFVAGAELFVDGGFAQV